MPVNDTLLDASDNDSDIGHDDGGLYILGQRPVGFLVEGVLLVGVSCFGLPANLMSLVVLVRKSQRTSFNRLLAAMAVFDTVYLVASVLMFGLPYLWPWYEHAAFPLVVPVGYFAVHFGRVGSAYVTLSVSVERYFAIVHPFRHFGWKKALMPASAFFAAAFNVPRLFELAYDPETMQVVHTSLRTQPAYVFYYIFWAKFLLVELLPYVGIIALNLCIRHQITGSWNFFKRRPRRQEFADTEWRPVATSPPLQPPSPSPMASPSEFNSSQRHGNVRSQQENLASVLVCISVLYVGCHSVKLVPDAYELVTCARSIENAGQMCDFPDAVVNVVSVSHFLLAFYSSLNFVIYFWRGSKFRADFYRTYSCFGGSGSPETTTAVVALAPVATARTCLLEARTSGSTQLQTSQASPSSQRSFTFIREATARSGTTVVASEAEAGRRQCEVRLEDQETAQPL